MVFKAKPLRGCRKCGKQIPLFVIDEGHKRYSGIRKFCYDCSPFRSYHSRKWMGEEQMAKTTRRCNRCKETLPVSEFHLTNTQRGYLNSYCKACQTDRVRNSRQRFKEECVAYKGGECERCGYSKCAAAFDFHHVGAKDFQISRYQRCSLTEEVKTELDKCQLLCANCHRETHYG